MMNKSLEKIRDIKSLINEVYQDELNEGARKNFRFRNRKRKT